MSRRAAVACGLLLSLGVTGCARRAEAPTPVLPTPLPRIPRDAPRFEIDSVTDSTATFRVYEARWIRPGLSGYAVDPLQRDALVARLRIVSRAGDRATALVTSQVTSVKSEHFLLVLRPPVPWWKQRLFWLGGAAGVGLGAGGAILAR